MHNVWLIPEVRSIILDYLAADTQKALAALARTCRTLSEPALDALWCVLHTLGPLLQCSREQDLYDDRDGSLRIFNEEEWNFVSCYAPRVRELTIVKSDRLSIEILRSVWFRTTMLLPNLRKLHWDHTHFLLIRLVLSPSLLHLDVHLPIDDDPDDIPSFVLAFLGCYHIICPELKSVHFRHRDMNWTSSSQLMAVISRAVCRFQTSEALTCDALSEEAFLHVARSCDIKWLSARLLHHSSDSLRRLAEYGTLDCPLFKNLRVLQLRVPNLSTVILYLKSRHQPFEKISIEFLDDPSPKVLHEFLTALSSPSRQQSLQRVRLCTCQPDTSHRQRRRIMATKSVVWPATTHRSPRVGERNTSPVYFEVLAPLMNLSLHDFEIHLNNPIFLDDNDLARLTHGWPNLEKFSVTTEGESSNFPTLMGMLLLLARCQKLSRLKLFIDAMTIPSLTLEESTMCNVVIDQLEVAPESPIEKTNVEGVTQFLLEHFPSLTRVSCPTSYRLSYPEVWEMVDSQIKKIKGLPVDSDSENYHWHVDSEPDWDSDNYHF